nr:uncharacterized mitochondrial protein AtMg00810-like [Tanacetum cinerariifolium]
MTTGDVFRRNIKIRSCHEFKGRDMMQDHLVKARFGGNAESKKIRKSMLKQEFSEFRIGEAEGLHKGYDRMQKILSQLNQLKAKPADKDINLKFLRALPSSWSQVALTLKTKGGLELISFDDLYYKLKTLEVDFKGYTTFSLSQSAGPSHSAFVSTISASKKMSYGDSPSYSLTTTYTTPSNSKTGSHRSGNVIEDVLQSFVADTEPEQQLAYEDFKQIEKLDLEEMDLKWQMAMLSVRVHKFEQKAGRKIDFDKKESARFNKKKVRCYKCQQRGHFARECRRKGGNDKQRYSSFKIKEIGKKDEDSKALITVDTLVDWTNHDGESDEVIASKEFGMIASCDTEDAIEEGVVKIYNLITGADTEEASTAGDAGEFALIGVTSKENELGWDDSAFSVFTTKSKDVEGRPLFNSDKSSEVNTNDFASNDSSVKSSEPKPNDSTSCASTSSVSTSENKAEIESNVGTPIQEPIIENPFPDAEDEGVFDSGCSRSMTGNKERLDDFQIYDKKNRVLFTDTECLVLSKDFKIPDDSMVVLRVPRKHNLYTINLNNLCPRGNLACLVANASVDEYVKWHRRMGHVNYKNMNKLVKEFKNAHIIEFCGSKGIKREYSNARTPQQNEVAERKNKTPIEAARTMLADSKLPTMFWTEAVRTACYVLNRVLVTSPHNETPYALLTRNIPSASHFKPFGCHVTILNTSDHLGKFDGKADKGYIVGYSASYKHVQANQSAGTQEATTNPVGTQDANSDSDCDGQVIIVPSYPSHNIQGTEPKDTSGDEVDDFPLNSADEIFQKKLARLKVSPGSIPVPTSSILVPAGDTLVSTDDVPFHTSSTTDSIFNDEPTTRFLSPSDLGNHDPSPGIFSSSSYDDEFDAALNNVASIVEVSPVATKRINIIHPQSLIIGDHTLAVQTRSTVKKTTTGEYAFISHIYDQQRDNHTDFQHCLFAFFLSQVEPMSVAQALEDPSWVDAMQEEMQQFKFQNVWVLVDLPEGFCGSSTSKKVYKVVKALYGLHQAPRAWYATLSTFLLKHGYRRGTIDKTLFLKKNKRDIILVQVYVDDIIFGSTKKAWCDEFKALMKGEFQMSAMGELTFFLGLQVQQRHDGMFISQDKYVQEILNKFDLRSVRTSTTPYEAPKPKSKNESNSPVNVHLYRSMIGLLMYLIASRPDIIFTLSACLRNQVTHTTSNLEAVKKIFKYLKGQPKLGLWHPRELPFVLEAYSDSDYARENKDRKSTTGGCQFLGSRLISWQCKKQTIVATSSTEAEYVAAANCCG